MALLRGATQSPVNASKGVGVALVELDLESGELTYSVNFRDLTGEATTGLHIHRAKPGLNGPIIYDLGFYGEPCRSISRARCEVCCPSTWVSTRPTWMEASCT